MKNLKELIMAKPDLRKLDLSFSEITNLDDYLYEFAKFKYLQILDLSGNRLETLPIDLSLMEKLEAIDLLGNPILNLQRTLKSLQSLPSLIELNIAILDENSEKSIQLLLPKLKILNGHFKGNLFNRQFVYF